MQDDKPWRRRDLFELWLGLLRREKTRWIAGVLFLAATALANGALVAAGLEGQTYGRMGAAVGAREEPGSFTFWTTWHAVTAVVLDLILLCAVIAWWRDRRRQTSAPTPS